GGGRERRRRDQRVEARGQGRVVLGVDARVRERALRLLQRLVLGGGERGARVVELGLDATHGLERRVDARRRRVEHLGVEAGELHRRELGAEERQYAVEGDCHGHVFT